MIQKNIVVVLCQLDCFYNLSGRDTKIAKYQYGKKPKRIGEEAKKKPRRAKYKKKAKVV